MYCKILNLKNKIMQNKKKTLVFVAVLFCITSTKVGFAYYYTEGSYTGSASIEIPAFAPKVNDSYDISRSISLTNTITNGKRLAPGAVGKFKIDIDFSNMGYDSYYKISFDRTNIPTNIHFYADEELTKEITNIEGVQLKDYENKKAEHYIYWKWIYNNTTESNENDSLYMNKEITIPFTAEIMQKVNDYETLVVNNYERPTGRVYLSGNSGSFNLNVDFKNISSASNYKIIFDKEDKSEVVHLYSDSLFQNEITSLNINYDGENTLVSNTIYWRKDDSSLVSLYYIVY